MAILVDYVCPSCGCREERWTPSPPATTSRCAGCGGESRRAFAAIGLSRGGGAPAAPADRATPAARGESICARFPQVPGLCHMSESAGRMWVAKYLKDGRAIDREAERQEKAAAVKAPTLADAITHQHAPAPAPTEA